MNKATAPINFWIQWQTAALDEGFAAARKMLRLPLLGQHLKEVHKGVTPSELIYE
jgi:hypothetical protein